MQEPPQMNMPLMWHVIENGVDGLLGGCNCQE